MATPIPESPKLDVTVRVGCNLVYQVSGTAMLLLNLQRETAPGKTQPLRGSASGSARDLLGNVQTLKFRPAGDGGTQDLIAEFSITHLEFLRFDVEVRPEGAARPLAVQFQQQFFNADR